MTGLVPSLRNLYSSLVDFNCSIMLLLALKNYGVTLSKYVKHMYHHSTPFAMLIFRKPRHMEIILQEYHGTQLLTQKRSKGLGLRYLLS